MHYYCISFTHKNTDIATREKLSLSDESKKTALYELISRDVNVFESLVLSTCNRVEIMVFASEINSMDDFLITCIEKVCKTGQKDALLKRVDAYEDSGAIHHLFSVASSLDSLVIGETQIAGQLKDAFKFAMLHGSCGVNISRAVHYAFKTAAIIRNATQISKNPVSVASVAISKAKTLTELKGAKTLVVGAGQMGELACKNLLKEEAKITLINRNLQRAKELDFKLGDQNVKVLPLEKLKESLNTHSVIFSATNSNEPVITDVDLQEVDFKRYFFDLAVPRDIDLSESDKIRVIAVDDLEDIVRKNLALREHQAQNAYAIISDQTKNFYDDLARLATAPLVKQIRLLLKDQAEGELKKALKKGYLKNSDEMEARALVRQVVNAIFHKPTINLKKISGKVQNDTVVNSLRYLFDLKEDLEDLNYKHKMENEDEI